MTPIQRSLEHIILQMHLQSELLALIVTGMTTPDKRLAANLMIQNVDDALDDLYAPDEEPQNVETPCRENHPAADNKTEIQNTY